MRSFSQFFFFTMRSLKKKYVMPNIVFDIYLGKKYNETNWEKYILKNCKFVRNLGNLEF